MWNSCREEAMGNLTSLSSFFSLRPRIPLALMTSGTSRVVRPFFKTTSRTT